MSFIPKNNISIVTPRRGVNDEGMGKKHALCRLISQANTDFVWMQDDDVKFKDLHAAIEQLQLKDIDLLILPLRMESEYQNPSLLERLQIAE